MRKSLSLVLLLVLLLFVFTACGTYDAATGGAVDIAPETPEDSTTDIGTAEPQQPTEIVAAESEPEPALEVPESEPESVPAPSLTDEEAAESADWVITATFADGGMTKVAAVQTLPDSGELKQNFVFSTTNRDRVIERLATKLGMSGDAITNIITWVGDAPESHSRK